LAIANSQPTRQSGATVVWLGEKKKDQLEVGVDLDKSDNFWGVIFPDDSGSFQAPLGSVGSQQPVGIPPASESKTPAISASPTQTPAPNLPPSNPTTTPVPPALVPPQVKPAPAASGAPASRPAVAAKGASLDAAAVAAPAPKEQISEESLKQLGSEVILSMAQTMVKDAFQKGLASALQEFNRQASSTMDGLQKNTVEQAQLAIRLSMDEALKSVLAEATAQWEAAAQMMSARHLDAYRQTLESTLQKSEQRVAERLEQYESRFNAGAARICQNLAMRLAPARASQIKDSVSMDLLA
jgi:hypothetical protein